MLEGWRLAPLDFPPAIEDGRMPPVPQELFVIVTKDAHPTAHWNMSLGTIASAGAAFAQSNPDLYLENRDEWLPWLPNPAFRTFISLHSLRVTSDMRAEYNAELARIRGFRSLPSRVACLYAWGSLDDALTAKSKIRGRFDGQILRCKPSAILRSARCNSALVNLAQRAERRGFFTDQETVDAVWNAYWSGSGNPIAMERQDLLNPNGPPETVKMSDEPLWEWLIDGTLDIVGPVELSG